MVTSKKFGENIDIIFKGITPAITIAVVVT
jgi:hypothetical protein